MVKHQCANADGDGRWAMLPRRGFGWLTGGLRGCMCAHHLSAPFSSTPSEGGGWRERSNLSSCLGAHWARSVCLLTMNKHVDTAPAVP